MALQDMGVRLEQRVPVWVSSSILEACLPDARVTRRVQGALRATQLPVYGAWSMERPPQECWAAGTWGGGWCAGQGCGYQRGAAPRTRYLTSLRFVVLLQPPYLRMRKN